MGGIFRNHNGDYLNNFARNLSQENALCVKLVTTILTMEYVSNLNLNKLWLETDSKSSMMPWMLRIRWDNFIQALKKFYFLATNIYNEGNHCVDKLANLDLVITNA